MTVACYVRVSSRRQKDDSQRAEIQKWLDANGIDPRQVEWYADKEPASPNGEQTRHATPTLLRFALREVSRPG